jgi:hypothetical protein
MHIPPVELRPDPVGWGIPIQRMQNMLNIVKKRPEKDTIGVLSVYCIEKTAICRSYGISKFPAAPSREAGPRGIRSLTIHPEEQ